METQLPCVREADPSPLVYLAPSGVQKERILPEHMFVLPFAQSSVPKPGSKRDFVRIPNKKVRGVQAGKLGVRDRADNRA